MLAAAPKPGSPSTAPTRAAGQHGVDALGGIVGPGVDHQHVEVRGSPGRRGRAQHLVEAGPPGRRGSPRRRPRAAATERSSAAGSTTRGRYAEPRAATADPPARSAGRVGRHVRHRRDLRRRRRQAVENTLYTAVGLGILGFQHLQVQRRELAKQVAGAVRQVTEPGRAHRRRRLSPARDRALPPVPRVAVDLTSLLDPLTGVGVFVARAGRPGWPARDDLALTAFAVTWRGRRPAAPRSSPPAWPSSTGPMAARPLHEAWRRADHPRIDRWIGRHDVVWGPNFVVPPARGRPRSSTVHDLTPVRFPELANELHAGLPRADPPGAGPGRVGPHAVRVRARRGRSTHFGADPDRVVAIHHGVGDRPVGARPTAAAAERWPGGDRYVLAVGTVEPRKDLPTLVRAFDALAADDPDLRLVIAGGDGWGAEALTAAVAAARHRDRIVRLGLGRRRRTGSTCWPRRRSSPTPPCTRASGCRRSRRWRPGSRWWPRRAGVAARGVRRRRRPRRRRRRRRPRRRARAGCSATPSTAPRWSRAGGAVAAAATTGVGRPTAGGPVPAGRVRSPVTDRSRSRDPVHERGPPTTYDDGP